MIRKSVKNSLCSVLSTALQRRDKAQSDSATLAGSCSSECSTLVNFVIDVPEVTADPHEYEGESLTDSLDDDNRAWSSPISRRSITASPPQCPTKTHSEISASRSQLSLLDEDECTWVMPRSRRSPTCRKRSVLFNSKPKTTKLSSGPCQSWHLLDPEERSWV